MSESFVRKTLNVEDITKKETYTLHDLDLIETKKGHVYIRINKKRAQASSIDKNAYLYELTNSIRRLNGLGLSETAQLDNNGDILLPLVMELQHLDGEIQLTIAGKTDNVIKVNNINGVYENYKTTYVIPLTDTIPDIVVKRENTVIATYELHQADWNQKNKLHPEYIKGSQEFIDIVEALNNKVTALETRVSALESK